MVEGAPHTSGHCLVALRSPLQSCWALSGRRCRSCCVRLLSLARRLLARSCSSGREWRRTAPRRETLGSTAGIVSPEALALNESNAKAGASLRKEKCKVSPLRQQPRGERGGRQLGSVDFGLG